jgi:hypothetical protein
MSSGLPIGEFTCQLTTTFVPGSRLKPAAGMRIGKDLGRARVLALKLRGWELFGIRGVKQSRNEAGNGEHS